MKRFLLLLCLIFSFSLYAQSADEEVKASKGGISEIPNAKRPMPIDKEKAEKIAKQIYYLSLISQRGLSADELSGFLSDSYSILSLL